MCALCKNVQRSTLTHKKWITVLSGIVRLIVGYISLKHTHIHTHLFPYRNMHTYLHTYTYSDNKYCVKKWKIVYRVLDIKFCRKPTHSYKHTYTAAPICTHTHTHTHLKAVIMYPGYQVNICVSVGNCICICRNIL